MKNAAIFVEGFQDRAFLSEWLKLTGLRIGRGPRGTGIYVKLTRTGSELWLVPTSGTSGLATAFGDFVATKSAEFDEYLVAIDSDELPAAEAERRTNTSLTTFLPAGSTLNITCWQPRLETVIEQGLRATYPTRFPAIDQFLRGRIDPPRATGKEAAHAFCAGWYPDNFGEDFYGHVLRTSELRTNIEGLMPQLFGHLTRLINR